MGCTVEDHFLFVAVTNALSVKRPVNILLSVSEEDWSRILKQVLSIVMNRFLLCPLTKMHKELFSSFLESNYYVRYKIFLLGKLE